MNEMCGKGKTLHLTFGGLLHVKNLKNKCMEQKFIEMAKTILVIDDSASLRQVVKMALSGAGYAVLEAGDGAAIHNETTLEFQAEQASEFLYFDLP